eukprot:353149-Chlamydomonas_euryale.AAC.8
MGGWVDGMDGPKEITAQRHVHEDGWVAGWTRGWTDRWMDRWTGGIALGVGRSIAKDWRSHCLAR